MEFKNLSYMLILIVLTVLYEKYKLSEQSKDEMKHYELVKNYLLNGSSLARSKKPIIWIHNEYDVNARNWESFYSRNTRCLNQPYMYLTIKSIIDQCGKDFNICLIDDESFSNIIPGWNIQLDHIAKPIKNHIRSLALAKVLHTYGGMLVPPSFICFESLINVYNSGLNGDHPFVGEFVTRNIASSLVTFFPNPILMGCKKECQIMNDYIHYIEQVVSRDNTREMDFKGNLSKWCYEQVLNHKMNVISGSMIGTKTENEDPVTIDILLNNSFFKLADTAVGLYIPSDEILNRTNYEWFAKLRPQEVLESNTMIGKYMLAGY